MDVPQLADRQCQWAKLSTLQQPQTSVRGTDSNCKQTRTPRLKVSKHVLARDSCVKLRQADLFVSTFDLTTVAGEVGGFTRPWSLLRRLASETSLQKQLLAESSVLSWWFSVFWPSPVWYLGCNLLWVTESLSMSLWHRLAQQLACECFWFYEYAFVKIT